MNKAIISFKKQYLKKYNEFIYSELDISNKKGFVKLNSMINSIIQMLTSLKDLKDLDGLCEEIFNHNTFLYYFIKQLKEYITLNAQF